MNKLKLTILGALFLSLVCTSAVAVQTENVFEQINTPQKAEGTNSLQVSDNNVLSVKENLLEQRYISNFKNCELLHIQQKYDFFGLKVGFTFDINGWVDNKCSYKLSGEINGIGKDIREVYGVKVTDEELSELKPVIECKFNQEQLDTLVDVVMQNRKSEKKYLGSILKKNDGKLLEQPEQLTPDEQKLLSMIVAGETCFIPNQEELMQKFGEIFEKL